jgi:pilus assembly protein CpaB
MLDNSKDNNFKILILALVLAVIAAFIGQWAINQQQEKVQVYKIADNVLEARTVLTEKNIEEVGVPAGEVHTNAVKDKKEIIGQALVTKAFYGQQIIHNMLAEHEEGNDLTHRISEGKRALTIPVDSFSSFGGNIQEIDRIDIIGNFEGVGDYSANFSRILLSNVKILKVIRNSGDISMLIVEVTPQESEILEYAKNASKSLGISLVPYDDGVSTSYGVNSESFLEQYIPRN